MSFAEHLNQRLLPIESCSELRAPPIGPLPLPPEPLSVSALTELTALPASAFVPEPRAQPSERDAVFAGAAVIAAELLLSAGTMEGHLSVRGLRELEGWQLPPLIKLMAKMNGQN